MFPQTTEFANWWLWAHPAIDDVFYLASTMFLKTIWVSCQHINLRKFHIKYVFLVSLLKFWRSGHPGPTFSSSNDTVRPSGSSALTLDMGPFLLPHFPPSPLLSLPLCTGLGLETPNRKGAQKGDILLSSQLSMVTQTLPVWNLIYWRTRLSYTYQSPECRNRWNEFNLGYRISFSCPNKKWRLFQTKWGQIRKSTFK